MASELGDVRAHFLRRGWVGQGSQIPTPAGGCVGTKPHCPRDLCASRSAASGAHWLLVYMLFFPGGPEILGGRAGQDMCLLSSGGLLYLGLPNCSPLL